jgi:hypothetical protein
MDPRLIDVHALRKEMKAQDKRRQQDPDRDPTFPRIWVMYQWIIPSKRSKRGPHWAIAGFFRTKRLKLPRIDHARRKLKIKPDAMVMLRDLQHAQRVGPPVRPPTQYNPLVDRRWLASSLRGRT